MSKQCDGSPGKPGRKDVGGVGWLGTEGYRTIISRCTGCETCATPVTPAHDTDDKQALMGAIEDVDAILVAAGLVDRSLSRADQHAVGAVLDAARETERLRALLQEAVDFVHTGNWIGDPEALEWREAFLKRIKL